MVEDAWNEVDRFTAQLSNVKAGDSDYDHLIENGQNAALKVIYKKNNMSR